MMLMQLLSLFIKYNLMCMYLYGRRYAVSGITPFEPDRVRQMLAWKQSNRENIWELSGQYQGDIQLGNARTLLTSKERHWPSKEIPFQFESSFTNEERKWILECLNPITENTCVRPRMKKSNEVDYIYVAVSKYYSCSEAFLEKRYL
ncbi:hypothetical protein ILUMI_19144 [Ignelater luminosus]|uniref:Peptidase M12A domain-containing protein n=1 Tax=Ignelater luminosus TaxID=2038154 RepID=A0A8K0CJW4_IGNLU|nr:hypothetical protein ILUMI_19144 [Ignelater luminosus]